MKDIHEHDVKRPGRPVELSDKRGSLLEQTHMYKEVTHTLREKYAGKYAENSIISKKFPDPAKAKKMTWDAASGATQTISGGVI